MRNYHYMPCVPLNPLKSPTWRGRELGKSFISRVIIGVTPFRVTYNLLTKPPAPPSKPFLH